MKKVNKINKRLKTAKLNKKASYSYDMSIKISCFNEENWFDLPTSEEEVYEYFEEIFTEEGIEFSEEDFTIEDIEFPIEVDLNDISDIDDANEIAEFCVRYDEDDLALLEEIAENEGENIWDIDLDDYLFIYADSEYDLANEYIDEIGGIEELDKDTLETYFNYEAYGKDLIIDGFTYLSKSRGYYLYQ